MTQWIQDSHLCLEINQGNDTDANVHIFTQAGEKSYQWTLCVKKFTLKTNLDNHIRVHIVGLIRVHSNCFSAKRVWWLKLSEMLGKCVRNAKMPGDNQYMQFFLSQGQKIIFEKNIL